MLMFCCGGGQAPVLILPSPLQKPAITRVSSVESSTSTTRPTRSTWPYMPPSVSPFSSWGMGTPGEGQGLALTKNLELFRGRSHQGELGSGLSGVCV